MIRSCPPVKPANVTLAAVLQEYNHGPYHSRYRWLVNTYLPMQGTIKSLLNGVVVIAVVLWLMRIFGLLDYLNTINFHK